LKEEIMNKIMRELTENEVETIIRNFNNNDSIKFLQDCIEVIGNEDRFLILNLLHNKPCLLSEIKKSLKRNLPSISHHVRILEEHKFIQSTKKGKFKEYSISKEKFKKLLDVWNQWFEAIRSNNY
jgi:predicted transcriptional regulator